MLEAQEEFLIKARKRKHRSQKQQRGRTQRAG